MPVATHLPAVPSQIARGTRPDRPGGSAAHADMVPTLTDGSRHCPFNCPCMYELIHFDR
jgi:hypothetical protein